MHTSLAIVKVLLSMWTPLKQLLRFCSQCAHLLSNCQGFALNVHTSQAIVKVLQMCTPHKQLSRFCSQRAHLTSNCLSASCRGAVSGPSLPTPPPPRPKKTTIVVVLKGFDVETFRGSKHEILGPRKVRPRSGQARLT